MPRLFLPLFLLPIVLLAACRHTGDGSNGGPETAPTGPQVLSENDLQSGLKGRIAFEVHIKPVLQARCVTCHDGKTKGLFSMTSRDAVFQAGALGPRIVPGRPQQSLLFLNPRGTHSAVNVMPPVGNRLTKQELVILRRWIEQGAEWPAGAAGRLKPAP